MNVEKNDKIAIFDRLADQNSRIVTHTHNYSAGHKIPLHFTIAISWSMRPVRK